MSKYKLNAMAAFAANIEIEANSRNEVFEKYERMRERGELPWKFVDTMDINCDEVTDEEGFDKFARDFHSGMYNQ